MAFSSRESGRLFVNYGKQLKQIFILFSLFALGFIGITELPVPGVVTELRLDEGSGTLSSDNSGNGHNATLVNGTAWTAGKYGQALSFDGNNDYVSMADHANFTLDPGQSYTWSAWVRNNNFNQWGTVWSQTIDANNFFYYYAHSSNDSHAGPVTNGVSIYWWTNGGSNRLVVHSNNNVLTAGVWSHIAITYDPSLAQNSRITIYVNGIDVTNRSDISSSGTLSTLNPTNTRIGANQPYGETINAAIDEVRYYRRLLSQEEIQTDMNIGNEPDTEDPLVNITNPAPGNVSGIVNITATATDNVGVAGVQFQLDGANLGAEDNSNPYSFSWNTATVSNGNHTLTAIARDAEGNTSSSSISVNVNNLVDEESPAVTITSPTNGSVVSGLVQISASATDDIGVTGVQFLLDGSNLGSEDLSAPFNTSWSTTSLANGNYTLTARARDEAGNITVSAPVSVTVANNNLVAAFGFNETSGLTANDNSGNNNHGTLVNGPAWNSSGRFGGALQFDGANDMVNIADANSLDLTNGMTLEAWVNPSNLTGYKTVICKDRGTSGFSYVLSANNNASNVNNQRPNSRIRVGSSNRTVTGNSKLPLNTWSHIACTYDGANFRYFINGVQVANVEGTGNITTTNDLLHIGGTTVFNQFFSGRIDEVRIYNKALSQAEIQSDMNTPVAPDNENPTVALSAPAAGEVSGTISINANASDNTGVAGVQFLPDGANLGAEDLVAPYSFSWNTTTVPNGTYTLSARARDASGNIATADNIVVSVNNDTEPPTITITSPSAGTVQGTIDLNATASDNVGVMGVQFFIDGNPIGSEDTNSPYTISWNSTSITDGNHTLTARARDAAGNNTNSDPVSINVLNNPPDTEDTSVSISLPVPGDVSGTINLTAAASDNVGIVGVQFLVNGVAYGAEDQSFPYLIAWNTEAIPNGSYTISAIARDAAGNTATASDIQVNVNNVPDMESPVINLLSPAAGNVSGTVNITANATDNKGVVGVQFLLNGANLGSEDLSAPYTFSWNTNTEANGPYTISARARDAAGNTTVSDGINVNVSNTTGLIAAYPLNEPSGTNAIDISGNNHPGTLVNSPTRIAGRYEQALSFDGTNDYVNVPDHNDFTLNPTQDYTWSAWVRSNNFNQWSTVWSQTIDQNNFFYFYAHSSNDADAGPVTNGVSVYWWTNNGSNKLVAHSTNNVLTAGQWSHITVTYNASVAQASRFTIYVNGVDVTNRNDISSAGTLATLNPTNVRIGANQPYGEYINGAIDEVRFYRRLLSAAEVVTDMNTPLGIDETPPVVSVTSPAGGTNVHGKVNLIANASDNISLAGVQFMVDGVNVGPEITTPPFTYEWNSEMVSNGAHTISALARDAAGNITISSEVAVNVVPGFTLTLLTPARNVETTGVIDFRIYVTYNNGFTAPGGIALSVTGLPTNASGHFLFNPMSHQGETQLYVTTTGAPFGSYPITISATGEGITNSQNGTLNVTPAADFALMASPSIQNVSVGSATTFTINVTETNDYVSPVNLSITGLPSGVTASFNPASPVPVAASTLTINTTSSAPIGTYNLVVEGESGGLVRSVPITLTISSSASLWTVTSIGSTGVPNNTIRVGALRTDGLERIYVGTIATGRMLEYGWNGSGWDGPVDIGGSPSGIEIHDCNIGPGRGDGKDRLYAASYDFNIYEIWHDETGWHQLTMGNVGNNLGMHMDIGDGRNDGVTRVYAASTQQLYEFTWNGTSWTRLLVGPTPGAHGVVIGDGRNDGVNRIYIASISSGNFEAYWNGTSWTINSMGDAGDARGIGIGQGRNDGINRVYSAIYDGTMREFTWNGSAWTFSNMPSTGIQNIHAYITPGRNDGVNRVYTDNGNGKVWEYSWNGSSWTTYNMGGGSDYMYGLHFGRGRNDGLIRMYSTDRGSVNRVYEFSWTTPPPISFRRRLSPRISIWDTE